MLGDDFVEAAERALAAGQPGQVSDAELERVMTAAVRLYAAKTETDKPPAQPITPSAVTPTDIVVTVSDLIRAAGSQSLGRVDVVQSKKELREKSHA